MNFTRDELMGKLLSLECFEGVPSETSEAWVNSIMSLPQVSQVELENVVSYMDIVVSSFRDEVEFHLKRMSGFGGSEIGGISKSLEGKQVFRNSAYESIASKLFLRTPMKATGPMRRGTLYEQFAKENFEKRLTELGYEWEELADQQKNIIEDKENDVYPWCRSSLDGVYLINGEVVIVDFKCPSIEVIEEYKRVSAKFHVPNDSIADNYIPNAEERERANYSGAIPFEDYSYQLHHYYMDAAIKGIKADRIILSVFDCMNVESHFIEVEIDERIISNIKRAGEYYWNEYVLKGKVPPPNEANVVEINEDGSLDIDEGVLDDLKSISEKASYVNILSNENDKKLKAFKAEIKDLLSQLPSLGDNVLRVNGFDIKETYVFNDDLVEDRLIELGFSEVEIDRLREAPTYDTKIMKDTFFSMSSSVSELMNALANNDKQRVANAIGELNSSNTQAPPKKKGKFNFEKTKKALLSCKGEDYMSFVDRDFSIALSRKKSPEMDIKRETACDLNEDTIQQISYRLNQVPNLQM